MVFASREHNAFFVPLPPPQLQLHNLGEGQREWKKKVAKNGGVLRKTFCISPLQISPLGFWAVCCLSMVFSFPPPPAICNSNEYICSLGAVLSEPCTGPRLFSHPFLRPEMPAFLICTFWLLETKAPSPQPQAGRCAVGLRSNLLFPFRMEPISFYLEAAK